MANIWEKAKSILAKMTDFAMQQYCYVEFLFTFLDKMLNQKDF